MKIKRFSDQQETIAEKISAGIKKTGKSIGHAITHPKETGKKIGSYIKKHPDEAIVLGSSEIVPPVIAARLLKKGNKKGAAIAASITALPIGEGYIAGKVGYRTWKNKRKK